MRNNCLRLCCIGLPCLELLNPKLVLSFEDRSGSGALGKHDQSNLSSTGTPACYGSVKFGSSSRGGPSQSEALATALLKKGLVCLELGAQAGLHRNHPRDLKTCRFFCSSLWQLSWAGGETRRRPRMETASTEVWALDISLTK